MAWYSLAVEEEKQKKIFGPCNKKSAHLFSLALSEVTEWLIQKLFSTATNEVQEFETKVQDGLLVALTATLHDTTSNTFRFDIR